GPEAHDLLEAVGQVGAHHVERGVRKVQHAHHAEDQGQARRHHEQQQAIYRAVKQGYGEEFHTLKAKVETRASPQPRRRQGWAASWVKPDVSSCRWLPPDSRLLRP